MDRPVGRILTAIWLTFAAVAAAFAQGTTAGGLTTLNPDHGVGTNLAQHSSFETSSQAWTFSSPFSIDTVTARTGKRSLRLHDAAAQRFTASATQSISLKRGTYKISAWLKTDALGANIKGSGVRLSLWFKSSDGQHVWPSTSVVSGTSDWTRLERENITVPTDQTVTLKIDAYGKPDGTAWLDDVSVAEQLPAPLDVFMLYPNYRGLMFDDQSPILRFDVNVSKPADASEVTATLEEELTGTLVARFRAPATRTMSMSLDGSGLRPGRPYLARFTLLNATGTAYSAPPYRVLRLSAAARNAMNVSFDARNRLLVRGKPRFVLGVYDSGVGYTTTPRAWDKVLWSPDSLRRMDGLRINLYLNYHFGAATVVSMNALMTTLEQRGILYLHTGNCFEAKAAPPGTPIHASDDYVTSLASHPGFAGFYVADECEPEVVPSVFGQYRRLKALAPGTMTLGALIARDNLFMWRDTVDVIATDPYPLYGSEPPAGYPHDAVARSTRLAQVSVKNSRPVWTVLQFFKFTSKGRWPTRAEMRSHAYMAIVEGAQGLLWWSLGNGSGALAITCGQQTIWCEERTAHFADLKAVVNELADLEPALLSPDTPEHLLHVSSASVKTKVKGNILIASNLTRLPLQVTFTWHTSLARVAALPAIAIPVSRAQFTDAFGPYEARVYRVSPSASAK